MERLTVTVDSDKPVAALACPWRYRGRTFVTVVVKATFAFELGRARAGAAPLGSSALVGSFVRAEPVSPEERLSASGAVVASSDLAPAMSGAGVVLTGHAVAPGNAPTQGIATRLVVARAGAPIIDKSVFVLGDPLAGSTGSAGQRASFVRMPLVYARAMGGRHAADNPLGVGFGANLIDRIDPSRAACYAPIASHWPARAGLLGGRARAALDDAIPELPDDFDFAYFQSAPRDQRAEVWSCDETITLHGMHADHAQLELRLPGAEVHVRADARGVTSAWSRARCDSLIIDADLLRVTALFRAPIDLGHHDPLAVRCTTVVRSLARIASAATQRATASADAIATRWANAARSSGGGEVDTVTGGAASGPALPFGEDEVTLRSAERSGVIAVKTAPIAAAAASGAAASTASQPAAEQAKAIADRWTARLASEMANEDSTMPSSGRTVANPLPFHGQVAAPPPYVPAVAEARASRGATATPLPDRAKLKPPKPPQPPSVPPVAPPPWPLEQPRAPQRPPTIGASLASKATPSFMLQQRPSSPAGPAPAPPPLVTEIARGEQTAEPPEVAQRNEIAASAEIASPAPAPPQRLEASPASPSQPLSDVARELQERFNRGETLAGTRAPKADLRGLSIPNASLAGAQLEGATLTGLDLSGCEMRGASLKDANLAGATLTRANLEDARLEAADLSGAILTEARLLRAQLAGANLQGANLERAQLRGATLTGAILSRARLVEADLIEADVSKASLDQTSFEKAKLASARFTTARGDGVLFTGADLANASFDRATFTKATFSNTAAKGSRWDETQLDGADFTRSDLANASFTGARLDHAVLRAARLTNASLRSALAASADFTEVEASGARLQKLTAPKSTWVKANLASANLREASLPDADFGSADLSRVQADASDLSRAILRDVKLERASLREAKLVGADLRGAKPSKADLREADLSQAKLEGCDLSEARTEGATLP